MPPRRGFGKRSNVKDRSRSGYEERLKHYFQEKSIPFEYETETIHYTVPSSQHKYRPDFIFHKKDKTIMYLESKGKFDAEDRRKMILVKQQYKDIDLRILFMRDQPIRKGSKTKYSDWAIKNNYLFAIGEELPDKWLKELQH